MPGPEQHEAPPLTEEQQAAVDKLRAVLEAKAAEATRELERAWREKLKAELPLPMKWLRAEGYPTKGKRGELGVAALAELTSVLKPWAATDGKLPEPEWDDS